MKRSSPMQRHLQIEALEDRSVPAIVNVSWTDPDDPPPATERFAVIDENAGPDGWGAISLTNPETGTSTTLSDNRTVGYRAWGRPTGGVVESINGVDYLLVVDSHGGRDGYGAIRRVNLATGSVQLVADNWMIGYRALVRPQAIVFEQSPGGDYLLVVDSAGGRDGRGSVKRLNLQSRGVQLVSDNWTIGYGAFNAPTGAALETVNGTNYLLVIDPSGGRDGYGSVRRVNLTTGGTQLVADNYTIGYRALVRPNSGIVETSGGSRYLRIVDPLGGSFFQPTVRLINLNTGSAGLTAIGGQAGAIDGIAAASDGAHFLSEVDRFDPLDAVVDEDSMQLVAVALSSYDSGFFAESSGDIYFKDGTDFERVGVDLAQTIIPRDRQSAYGLRSDGLLLKWQGATPYVLQTRVLSVNLNADGQTVFIARQSRSALAEYPTDGYSMVAADHVNRIRLDPSKFDDYYRMYSGQITRELGFRFLDLNDEGKMAVFATIVAHQMKPYGFNAALVNTDHDASLARLLAAPQMACDRYCYLTMLLYERGRTEMGLQPLNWNMVGFDVQSAIGNHAQLFVSGGGAPLLLDPTFGLVARTELNYIMNGNALGFSYVREPAYRVEGDLNLANALYNENIVRIRQALWAGTYNLPRDIVTFGWSPIIYQHAENILGL